MPVFWVNPKRRIMSTRGSFPTFFPSLIVPTFDDCARISVTVRSRTAGRSSVVGFLHDPVPHLDAPLHLQVGLRGHQATLERGRHRDHLEGRARFVLVGDRHVALQDGIGVAVRVRVEQRGVGHGQHLAGARVEHDGGRLLGAELLEHVAQHLLGLPLDVLVDGENDRVPVGALVVREDLEATPAAVSDVVPLTRLTGKYFLVLQFETGKTLAIGSPTQPRSCGARTPLGYTRLSAGLTSIPSRPSDSARSATLGSTMRARTLYPPSLVSPASSCASGTLNVEARLLAAFCRVVHEIRIRHHRWPCAWTPPVQHPLDRR